jgi:hypothetical protein
MQGRIRKNKERKAQQVYPPSPLIMSKTFRSSQGEQVAWQVILEQKASVIFILNSIRSSPTTTTEERSTLRLDSIDNQLSSYIVKGVTI